MPVVEVPCPGCGAKLKAPDSLAGKKAKCKKCGAPVRIPGAPAGDSVGEPQALSVLAMPVPPLPDDDATEVMMAEAIDPIEVTLPLPANPPAKPAAALPSADAFDFGKPAAKPAFGAAKPTPKSAAPAPAVAQTVKAPTKPAAPAPAPAAKSPPKPAAKPLSLDDDDDLQPVAESPKPSAPAAKAKAAPAPAVSAPDGDNPFAFSSSPAKAEPPSKAKRRDEPEDEAPPPKKTRKKVEQEDEEEPAPAKSKARAEPQEESGGGGFNPFADFGGEPEAPAKLTKSKRRDEEEPEEKPKKKRKGDEDEEEPAPAKSKAKPKEASGGGGGFNPFADFSGEPEASEKPTKSKRRDDDEDEPDEKPRKNRKGDDEPEEPEKPRYQRKQEDKGSLRKSLIRTAVIGGIALLLAVAAVAIYVRDKRRDAAEQAKEDKKNEPPAAVAPEPPPAPPAKVDPPKNPDPKGPKNPDPKAKDKEPDPKAKDKEPVPKPKDKEPPPVPSRPTTVALPKLKAFTVAALPAAPAQTDPARAGARVDVPLTAVKRVFPPLDAKTGDALVLVQTNAGLGGKGEKLALDSYSPTGDFVASARIEFDGDGSPLPIADVFASDKGVFFLAASAGKLSVWAVGDKTKQLDAIDPYADEPEHAKAGLAAAYFSKDQTQIVTVTTGGALLLFDLPTRKVVSKFVPPNNVPGRVVQGLSVARADKNESVVLAVSGVLYQVSASPGLEVLRTHDLGGDVGRSLGLAVSGTPGRLLYVFETVPDKSGKKDRAVLGLSLGDKAKPVLHPLPAALGEPKGALWSNATSGGVILDRGVLWFDDDEGKFQPLVSTQTPAASLCYGDEKLFWFVIDRPKAPGKSVLVALSVEFNDRASFQESYPAKAIRAVRIDHNGLSK